jgi:transcriptional regulator with XRE-family HTH domain
MAIYRQLTICRRVKALRINAGMTQSDVAEHMSISQAAYSRLETGEVEISVLKLLELCDLYGVKARDIVDDV